jgi:hypothetical protein
VLGHARRLQKRERPPWAQSASAPHSASVAQSSAQSSPSGDIDGSSYPGGQPRSFGTTRRGALGARRELATAPLATLSLGGVAFSVSVGLAQATTRARHAPTTATLRAKSIPRRCHDRARASPRGAAVRTAGTRARAALHAVRIASTDGRCGVP